MTCKQCGGDGWKVITLPDGELDQVKCDHDLKTTLYVLPEADTHCFDEDTKTDCWSFSRGLLVQEIAKAELRGREAMRQECLDLCNDLHHQWRFGEDSTSGPKECADAIKGIK